MSGIWQRPAPASGGGALTNRYTISAVSAQGNAATNPSDVFIAAAHGGRSNFLSGRVRRSTAAKIRQNAPWAESPHCSLSRQQSSGDCRENRGSPGSCPTLPASISDSHATRRGDRASAACPRDSAGSSRYPASVTRRPRCSRWQEMQYLRVQRVAGLLEARLVEAEHRVPVLRESRGKPRHSRLPAGCRPKSAALSRSHPSRWRTLACNCWRRLPGAGRWQSSQATSAWPLTSQRPARMPGLLPGPQQQDEQQRTGQATEDQPEILPKASAHMALTVTSPFHSRQSRA
jgi:hypothetical protein